MISFTCMKFPFIVHVVVYVIVYVITQTFPTIAPASPPSQSRARRCHLRSPRTVTEGAQA